MEEKRYSIGGREFALAPMTARQLKLVNQTLRCAVSETGIDAAGNDNPMLIYAAVWTALVETEKVGKYLSLIIVPAGSGWSETTAVEVEKFLAGIGPDELVGLYTKAATDFFAGNPNSTQNMFLSLSGFIKNSGPLVRAWQKNLEEAVKVRKSLIPQDPPVSMEST